jgi:phytoene desaturase
VAEVAVVGGGVGGMAAALRLRAAGHAVVLLERDRALGGKLAARSAGGFTWDTGPSLLTLPHVFDDLLAVAGTRLDEVVALERLDPICRYRWPDGTGFDHRAGLEEAAAEVEAMAPGEGAAFRAYLGHARTIWETAERTFFAGPLESPASLVRRMRSPRDLVAIDPLRTLHARARASFSDPRLVQWAGRYATYSGSSPLRAPATLGCIPWIEQHHGAWYVRGGLARLAGALGGVLAGAGVEVRTGPAAEVAAVEADGEAVRGVRLAGGEVVGADVVVANVDAHHLYADLLPDERARRRSDRAPRSTSGFALLLGVEGATGGLAHHTISFSADHVGEHRAIAAGRLPADPTVYVAAPPDPALAPPGCESWFVLVNVPPLGGIDWEAEAPRHRDRLLELLARRGWDLAGRLREVEVVTPLDLAARHGAWRGSIYGTSSDGRRAAFLRPANRGPRRGLYLVGGSSHPGGGLPLVALSGAIVATMVDHDLTPSRRRPH